MKRMTLTTMAVAALLALTGCKGNSQHADNCKNVKAKAILWVDFDRKKMPLPDGTTIRTAKVLAEVSSFGSVKIVSFCKEQELEVVNYLVKRLEAYTIRKEMLDAGYVTPGEQQYLQLRYIPAWMKK